MSSREISYGSFKSFEELISGKYIYVDKTAALCAMAQDNESFLLTRPRRMGKSTAVSGLKYLFSHGTKGTKGLACQELWKEPYRYYVFHLDWSDFNCSSFNTILDDYRLQLQEYADFFGITLPEVPNFTYNFRYLITECKKKLADEAFLNRHPELTVGDRPFCNTEVVLLIDEYDAPLTHALNNPKLFEQLRAAYQSFFSSIKRMNFRFVFITGVSSYAQTSIFSGANQFTNISLDPDFATCCGYTEEELKRYFGPELKSAQEILNLESQEQLLELIHYHYDGYLFSDEPTPNCHVFNPISISKFLKQPSLGFQPYWATTGGLSSLLPLLLKSTSYQMTIELLQKLVPAFNAGDEQSQQLANNISPFFLSMSLSNLDINTSSLFDTVFTVNINKLLVKLDNLNNICTDNAATILFQTGYLSIKSYNEPKLLGRTVNLGFANLEVKSFLIMQLADHANLVNLELMQNVSELSERHDEIYAELHQGGKPLAELLDGFLHETPRELFAKGNYENVITAFLYHFFIHAKFKVQLQVLFATGIADLIIYEDGEIPFEDVVIKFKLAREGDNVFSLLKEGLNQIVEKRYGKTWKNPHPKRYCVVIANEIKEVAAIGEVDDNNGLHTVYVAQKYQVGSLPATITATNGVATNAAQTDAKV